MIADSICLVLEGKSIVTDWEGVVAIPTVDYDVKPVENQKVLVPLSCQPIFVINENGRSFFFDGKSWSENVETTVDADDPLMLRVTVKGTFFHVLTSRGKRIRPVSLKVLDIFTPVLSIAKPEGQSSCHATAAT